MKASESEPYLQSIDSELLPLGFKRSKSSFEWIRKHDKANNEWVHCSFGRFSGVNPSFGIQYSDIGSLIPKDIKNSFGVIVMLGSLTGDYYPTPETPPTKITQDIIKFAVPMLTILRDRLKVSELLETESPKNWPVFSASDRIRLLPLLLANEGRIGDALTKLTEFEKAAPSNDQIIPKYGVFAGYFRESYMKYLPF